MKPLFTTKDLEENRRITRGYNRNSLRGLVSAAYQYMEEARVEDAIRTLEIIGSSRSKGSSLFNANLAYKLANRISDEYPEIDQARINKVREAIIEKISDITRGKVAKASSYAEPSTRLSSTASALTMA